LQEEVIRNVLQGHDSLVILPTGGGKSLCFQIPALVTGGLTVVVSPLISLMQDQVEQLRQAGVAACFLNSTLTPEQYNTILNDLRARRLRLVYLAPETLLKPRVLAVLDEAGVTCLAIDEAHCISEWGHDFRPEYRQLAGVRKRFGTAVCLALTATATPRVRQDILESLDLDAANQFVGSFNRENLFLEVRPKESPARQVLEFLADFSEQSGIIYCATRRQVDELAAYLARQGHAVAPYHAGLADAERQRNQEAFVRDDLQIIVATVAFGMGIDKPNVRFVIHHDLPKNIEGYYQEIGRAGRDGLPARCLLLFGYGDIHKVKYFIDRKEEAEQRLARNHLEAMVAYAESRVCRRQPLLGYFGERYRAEGGEGGCTMCDNCAAGARPLTDLTVPAQKFLSCVKRTGEMFGAAHIVDVLRGSNNRKIQQHGHQHLSTWGIGMEFAAKQWFHLARQFLQHGLLVQDSTHGSLKLTTPAWRVLRGEETFHGEVPVATVPTATTPAAKQQGGEQEMARHPGLFAELRAKRKELADQAGVPPYAVFPDRTLLELAARLPETPAQLPAIHGIGRVKLAQYGAVFLEVINGYCRDRGITDRPAGREEEMQPGSPEVAAVKPRYVEVGELFCDGLPVSGCMERYRVKQDTVLNHLRHYALDGHRLPAAGLRQALTLSPERQKQVRDIFARLGPERLGPVYQELEGRVDYGELKLMQLLWLTEGEGPASLNGPE